MVIPVMVGVTLFSFLMLHLAPGDPAVLMAGVEQREEVIQAIRAEYGLDKPLYVQYVRYLGGAIRGDFGRSILTRWPKQVFALSKWP